MQYSTPVLLIIKSLRLLLGPFFIAGLGNMNHNR